MFQNLDILSHRWLILSFFNAKNHKRWKIDTEILLYFLLNLICIHEYSVQSAKKIGGHSKKRGHVKFWIFKSKIIVFEFFY